MPIQTRASPGVASGSDEDLHALELGRKPARGLVAVEAGTGLKVELPTVVGAGESRAEDLAVAERVSLMWACIRESVRRPIDQKDGDFDAVRLHDGPSLGVEARQRNPDRPHAA
jgi:hypothetical protein